MLLKEINLGLPAGVNMDSIELGDFGPFPAVDSINDETTHAGAAIDSLESIDGFFQLEYNPNNLAYDQTMILVAVCKSMTEDGKYLMVSFPDSNPKNAIILDACDEATVRQTCKKFETIITRLGQEFTYTTWTTPY